MIINKTESSIELCIAPIGRLDTATAPLLEAELKKSILGKTTVIFDLKDLEYISSAGLRVLLSAQKCMNKQGTMTVINVSESVMDVFEVTGFSEILSIE